jgi:hypothetical protein
MIGARGHQALEELAARTYGVEISGGRLRPLLQQLLLETPCLKCLEIDDFGNQEDVAAGLAGGLRLNTLLEKLVFELDNPYDQNAAAHIITILELVRESYASASL